MNRTDNNIEILNIIINYIKKYPDIRFCQALYNLNILTNDNVDRFYEEPDITLSRIMKTNFMIEHE